MHETSDINITWKVSVFPAFPALMHTQPNQCPSFPDFFQIMVVFPATAAFRVSEINLIKINYVQNLRFIEGIWLSSTVMYRFWNKLEKAKINNYIRCNLAQNLCVHRKAYSRGMFCWTSILNIFLTIAENLFKQSLAKEEQCAYVEISQNLCDDLFSSIKQFTLGFRIIF